MTTTLDEPGRAIRIQSVSVAATRRIGRAVGRALMPGDWIGLTGDLGAGKTCLTQGLAEGLGVDPRVPVTSPTFVILQSYFGRLVLHHLDLYRLSHYEELVEIGYEDLLGPPGVCVVEWCDQLPESRPADGLIIQLEILSESRRILTSAALGRRGGALRAALVDATRGAAPPEGR